MIDYDKKRDELWKSIEILIELGEKELAYKIRVLYDTYFRPNWK